MNQKNQGNAIGISLILVVFILLCLITFGTLSYMLAKMDNELSISTTENITAYYQADVSAKNTLQEIDQTIAAAYAQVNSLDAYAMVLQAEYATTNQIRVAKSSDAVLLVFTTEVSEQETLTCSLSLTYPTQGSYYTITGWTLSTVS